MNHVGHTLALFADTFGPLWYTHNLTTLASCGEQGRCSGESTHLPPMWLWSDPRTLCRMWVESHFCSNGFSLGVPFCLPHKTNNPNSNLNWNQWTKNHFMDVSLLNSIIYSGKFTYMYITCSWRWTRVVVKSCKMWFTYIGFPINNFVFYSFHLNRHIPSKIMKVLSTLKAASLALVNTILPWWWQNLLALSRNHLSWWVLDGTCSYSILESQIYSMHMVGQAKVKGVLSFAKMEKRKNQN